MTIHTSERPASPRTPPASEHWDVIIVGGGTAGLSAALILARARRRVLVLDAQQPRNRFAPHMHGVLSRDGYSPLDMVADGYSEVRAADGVIRHALVVQARAVEDGFEVVTDAGERVTGRRLVLATGLRDEMPDIDGLAEQWGLGVVACPYCDGYEALGRAIAVLAGSAAGAVHKAHMLRSYSADITVFTALAGPLPDQDRLVLEARGVRIDDRGVTRVVTERGTLTGLELADGSVVSADVVFAEPTIHSLDEPLRQLGAERVDTPAGSLPGVDAFGRTSITGVWAIGNAVNPGALVPLAAGSGATAALALNGEFVEQEIAATAARIADAPSRVAGHDAAVDTIMDPTEHWEAHYATERGENGRVWSGKVNAAVERELASVTPGTALELGSGEGGDALWLAAQGWTVTAVDISPTALDVGAGKAAELDLENRVTWVQADLATWKPSEQYDLVTAAFLHSRIELPREQILRRAALAVAPGGRLLIVGHGPFPPELGHGENSHDTMPLPTAAEVLDSLHLGAGWVVETNAQVDRTFIWRDGRELTVADAVLRVRRDR